MPLRIGLYRMGGKKGCLFDRKENDGNYTPENSRWTNQHVQSRNRSNNHTITAFGETKCFADWRVDVRCVVSHGALYYRLKSLKWHPERAITEPPHEPFS